MAAESERRYRAAVDAQPDSRPEVEPKFAASDLESQGGRFHTVACLDVMIHYPQVCATSRLPSSRRHLLVAIPLLGMTHAMVTPLASPGAAVPRRQLCTLEHPCHLLQNGITQPENIVPDAYKRTRQMQWSHT